MNEAGTVEVKDFTLAPKGQKFKIDDDIFETIPEIPLGHFAEFAKIVGLNFRDEGAVDAIIEMLMKFLVDESATLFRSRTTDKKKPIALGHVLPIINWLLEVYGLRPTQPSSTSSTPSTVEDGTSSTAGASPEASTAQDSLPTDSSTSSTTTYSPAVSNPL